MGNLMRSRFLAAIAEGSKIFYCLLVGSKILVYVFGNDASVDRGV